MLWHITGCVSASAAPPRLVLDVCRPLAQQRQHCQQLYTARCGHALEGGRHAHLPTRSARKLAPQLLSGAAVGCTAYLQGAAADSGPCLMSGFDLENLLLDFSDLCYSRVLGRAGMLRAGHMTQVMTSVRGCCLAHTHWRGRTVVGCGTAWGWVVGAWAGGVLVGAAATPGRPCGPLLLRPQTHSCFFTQSSCCVARGVAGGEVLHVPVQRTYVGVAAVVLRGRPVVCCCWHEEWLLAFNSRPSISFDRSCVTLAHLVCCCCCVVDRLLMLTAAACWADGNPS